MPMPLQSMRDSSPWRPHRWLQLQRRTTMTPPAPQFGPHRRYSKIIRVICIAARS